MKHVLILVVASLFVVAGLALSSGAALAAPGEPRVVQGTLEWPAAVSNQPFVVIRGDDGRMFYADIASAQRRTPGQIAAGTRVAVLGIEGSRPYEIAGIAIGAGDASSLGLVPGRGPIESSATLTAGSTGSGDDMWRVDGTVEAVSGSTVALRGPDGRTQSVDLSQLNEATWRALRPGERISVFGMPRDDRRLIANGFIQSEAPMPAASPRLGR